MKLPCIRVDQPIGTFFISSIKASLLKKVTYSRKVDFEDSSLVGNQRKLSVQRIKEIKEFLSSKNATIPNTIILSANYYEDDSLEVDSYKRWSVEKNGDVYELTIPDEKLQICSIIDGQHRINGFEDTNIEMDLPCSIFIDLPPSLQAYVFATINFNQKKVDKSLAYQLFGYQLDESNRLSWSPDILAVKLSREFNTDGPFKGRIKLIHNEALVEDSWTISSAAFIDGVVSLISPNLKKDKYIVNKLKIVGIGSRSDLKGNARYPLRQYYIEGNDSAIYEIIKRYFQALEETLWAGKNDANIVFRAIGISAQFLLLKELILNEKVVLDKQLDFHGVLGPLADIDLDDEYFSARTATKKRMLDLFKFKLTLIDKTGLDPQILKAAKSNNTQ